GIGAVFGAMNTMYALVAARTREIGTLRALGFRSYDASADTRVIPGWRLATPVREWSAGRACPRKRRRFDSCRARDPLRVSLRFVAGGWPLLTRWSSTSRCSSTRWPAILDEVRNLLFGNRSETEVLCRGGEVVWRLSALDFDIP